MSKMIYLCTSGVFFQALTTQKLVFGRSSAPDPAGALTTLPKPSSQLGRGTVPPHILPPRRLRRLDLGAFGASDVRPPTQIPGYA